VGWHVADNIAVTPGSGTNIATDERTIAATTVHLQRVVDSGTQNIAAAQVTVSNSSTSIAAARDTRKRVVIVNRQTVPVYVEQTTATTSDFRMEPGDSLTLYSTGAIAGITSAAYTASGDAKVHVIEEYD
jgi:predicted YcjX-like family ATPase